MFIYRLISMTHYRGVTAAAIGVATTMGVDGITVALVDGVGASVGVDGVDVGKGIGVAVGVIIACGATRSRPYDT
jgi:hypothetical protein